jgi:hypothetical protein
MMEGVAMTDLPEPTLKPADDLVDETRRKIIAEEEYRAVTRERYASKKQGADKWLDVLNSSFALWLLSAVFLSGTGAIYGCWQKDRDAARATQEKELEAEKIRTQTAAEEEAKNKAAIERLDMEISYRFSQFLLSLRTVSEQGRTLGSPDPTQRKLQIAGPAMGIMKSLSQNSDEPPLYPEYATFALPTLMSELARRVPTRERQDIEQGIAKLLGESNSQMFETDDPAKEAAGRILGKVMLKRWKNAAFYHVDCSAREPFC